MEWSKHFIQRMFYNGASAYVKQLKHGEAFKKLSPVYGLALIDEVFSKKEEWFHHFKMLNVEDSHGLLEEPAAGDAEQGADGAQQRSVYGNKGECPVNGRCPINIWLVNYIFVVVSSLLIKSSSQG